NPSIKAMWESIAKKFNGRGLQGISMVCSGLAMWIGTPYEAIVQCALCVLMLSANDITETYGFINSLTFKRANHEVSRND
ncbi:DUF3693 domain-containing protein, partial [Vibrio sinaloensis]|uniref:DUF3693 domain-containing protein n=1 Tax=Photobacterium sp. (strain ATCC 43367) TaxID=379097 RepID=UPI0035E4E470